MKITRRKDGYWIVDTPEGVEHMGPYERKKDASDDMAGVKRFLDHGDKRAFMTSQKARK